MYAHRDDSVERGKSIQQKGGNLLKQGSKVSKRIDLIRQEHRPVTSLLPKKGNREAESALQMQVGGAKWRWASVRLFLGVALFFGET